MSCGGGISVESTALDEMARIHPPTTQRIENHSLASGCSNSITFDTIKLTMMDTAPKMPTVSGGNHVSARKSKVDAAKESAMAMINNGLTHTCPLSGCARLRCLVRGS